MWKQIKINSENNPSQEFSSTGPSNSAQHSSSAKQSSYSLLDDFGDP